jgi:hypothetical protein
VYTPRPTTGTGAGVGFGVLAVDGQVAVRAEVAREEISDSTGQ